jgi:hypothetical protein
MRDIDIAMEMSLDKNDGPDEVYYMDFFGNVYLHPGPLTPKQVAYLIIEKSAEIDGKIFRNEEFDRQRHLARIADLEAGRPWYIDLHPEKFPSRFERLGIKIH